MKLIIIAILIVGLLSGCTSNNEPEQTTTVKDDMFEIEVINEDVFWAIDVLHDYEGTPINPSLLVFDRHTAIIQFDTEYYEIGLNDNLTVSRTFDRNPDIFISKKAIIKLRPTVEDIMEKNATNMDILNLIVKVGERMARNEIIIPQSLWVKLVDDKTVTLAVEILTGANK